ncbi:MAG TPA: hypothetical protein VN723_10780 [Rhizomicrobium sp.]|jgi:hypothetical protein|nr:hypothetical protein [Rhizomicrobium sp.]
MLPKSMAQLTGVIVCSIVVFGTDLDVIDAVPLGVLSGGLAIFFVSMAEGREQARLLAARISRRRAGSN